MVLGSNFVKLVLSFFVGGCVNCPVHSMLLTLNSRGFANLFEGVSRNVTGLETSSTDLKFGWKLTGFEGMNLDGTNPSLSCALEDLSARLEKDDSLKN